MAKQTRVVLKNYFNTGDVPTEAQYADVMDSQLNLSENNEGNVDLTGNITASGDISSSEAGLFKKIGIGRRPGLSTAENYGQDVTLHISSSKPRVVVEATEGAPEIKYVGNAGVTGVLSFAEGAASTASAGWVSETRFAYRPGQAGKPFAVQQINKVGTKQEPFRIYSGSSDGVFNITSSHIGINTNDVTETLSINGSVSASGNITGSNLKLSGDLDVSSLSLASVTASAGFNIGGTSITSTAAELNKLDGATVTTAEINRLDGVTAANATFLRAMNQNVASDGSVTFASLKLTKTTVTAGNFGEVIATEGQSFTITINSIPAISAKGDTGEVFKTVANTISNDSILSTSVVLISCQADLSAVAFRVTDGSFKFAITNESTSIFNDGSATFNFTIF